MPRRCLHGESKSDRPRRLHWPRLLPLRAASHGTTGWLATFCRARSQLMTSQWKPTTTVTIARRSISCACNTYFLHCPWPLTLTYDLDFVSPSSYSHDWHVQKSRTVKDQLVKNRLETNGRMDKIDPIIFPLTRSVMTWNNVESYFSWFKFFLSPCIRLLAVWWLGAKSARVNDILACKYLLAKYSPI